MKKIVSIAVAVTMIAGVAASFVGCGQIYTAEIDWDVDLSKPIDLKGLFPNADMKAFGSDDTAEIIERETGYKVKYTELATSGMETAVSNYLNSRKDFNFMKLNDGCYTPYLDGTFLDLTELLEKTPEGQVLYQLIDLMDYGWESVTYTDDEGVDHIYGIPDFGYVHMVDNGLIWNTNHLEQIGFEAKYSHKLPETLSEVTWAFEQLQNKFNPDGKGSYRAFGLHGAANAEVSPLAGCFEVPNKFYVDANGKIQIKNYSDNMTDYVLYMNSLYKKGILSPSWNTAAFDTTVGAFASELHSCLYLPYWNIRALVNTVVEHLNVTAQDDAKKSEDKKIKEVMGINLEQWRTKMSASERFQLIHDDLLAWTLRIRGDGYTFENAGRTVSCKTQEKAMLSGDRGGVSYYTVIPAYMAKNARYVIDYLAKKMEAFANFFGGDEGKHWNKLTAAEIAQRGLPAAADYTEEKDADYTAHESFEDLICFVRPYSYSYKDARSGTEKLIEVNEPGMWIQLTERYASGQIAENSQYCTGTNSIAAKVYCHLHELGFNAWYYCDNFPDEETWISDPMFMSPTMKTWGPVNIVSRSHLLTGVEHAISANDPLGTLKVNREGAKSKNVGSNGRKYYYWSDEISEEMTAWYNANGRNK